MLEEIKQVISVRKRFGLTLTKTINVDTRSRMVNETGEIGKIQCKSDAIRQERLMAYYSGQL